MYSLAVHRLDSELDQPGTYVLMKSGKKMNQVKEILGKKRTQYPYGGELWKPWMSIFTTV